MSIASNVWKSCSRLVVADAAIDLAVRHVSAHPENLIRPYGTEDTKASWTSAAVGCEFTPGDGTRYAVMIVQTPGQMILTLTAPHSAAYPLNGVSDPSYVAEKWGGDNMWTGHVIDAFIKTFIETCNRLRQASPPCAAFSPAAG